jgi:hypothetical protein
MERLKMGQFQEKSMGGNPQATFSKHRFILWKMKTSFLRHI